MYGMNDMKYPARRGRCLRKDGNTMEKRTFQTLGDSVSLLGYGCMRFPTTPEGKIDREPSLKMIDYAYQNGVNYFDTAYMYHEGESEPFMGEALSRYPRGSYYVATKFPIWMELDFSTEKSISDIFEEQLAHLGGEYIDFYLIHGLNEKMLEKMLKYRVLDVIEKKRAEGKIRHLGFSFHDKPEILEKCVACHSWDFVQIQLNYYDWEFQNAKRQYEILVENDLPCVVMEPVRGGTFANFAPDINKLFTDARPGDSIASWAVRYAATLPNVMTVLSGMSTIEQVKDNVKTLSNFEPLTEKEYALIGKALEAHKALTMIPCTGCRYCMDCPAGVDIPKIFSVYNSAKFSGRMADFYRDIKGLDPACLPEHCVECGLCASHCPQGIHIPEELKKINELIQSAE